MAEFNKEKVHGTIKKMRHDGSTLKEIANKLNKEKLFTPKGFKWNSAIVGHYGLYHKLIARVQNTKGGEIGSTGNSVQGKKRKAARKQTETTRVHHVVEFTGHATGTTTDFQRVARNARLVAEIADSNLRPTTKSELISIFQHQH